MVWKTVNNTDPGTASEFGGDDIDKISNLFSGNLDVDSVDINSSFTIRDNKFSLRNPANTFSYVFQTSALAANRDVTLPLLTAADTFVFAGFANAWGTANQNIAATGKWQEGGVNISPIGLHDIYLDAGAFIPVDAGALATRIVDAGVDQKAFAYIPFAAGSVTFATAKIVLPRTYNLGTITAVLEWTSATEGSGTVEWDVSGCAVGDGEDMSTVVFGTAVTSTDTQFSINLLQTSPRTAAITLGNTPLDGNIIFLKIARDGVTDTFTEEAQLLGVWVEITTDAAVSA